MHSVEIFHKGSDVIGPMAQMREWFDARRVRPILFTMSRATRGMVFQLQFASAIEAAQRTRSAGVSSSKPPHAPHRRQHRRQHRHIGHCPDRQLAIAEGRAPAT